MRWGKAVIPAQATFVEGIATNEVVLEGLGGPDAELGAALGFHPVANRNNDVQVIQLGIVGFAVRGSYPEIPE